MRKNISAWDMLKESVDSPTVTITMPKEWAHELMRSLAASLEIEDVANDTKLDDTDGEHPEPDMDDVDLESDDDEDDLELDDDDEDDLELDDDDEDDLESDDDDEDVEEDLEIESSFAANLAGYSQPSINKRKF